MKKRQQTPIYVIILLLESEIEIDYLIIFYCPIIFRIIKTWRLVISGIFKNKINPLEFVYRLFID